MARIVVVRAAEAGFSPLGFPKFNAGRGDFQVLPAFIVGPEDEVLDQLRHHRELWAWCLTQGLTPPSTVAPRAT